MGKVRAATGGLAVLWILMIVIGWWRYADIPRLVGYDETIIHDAALGWAKTGKLAAPSMEGTPLSETFAIYPPLYPLAQGLVYRYFGFSAFTLKVVTKIGATLASLLGLLVLRRLWRRGTLSGGVATAAGVLWLTDWIRFWTSRQARMESWEVSFGVGAALLLAGGPERPWRWYGASALVGLALGTHFSAVIYYAPLVIGMLFFRRSLGWTRVATCAGLPLLVMATVWCAGHGARAWDALLVFRRIYAVEYQLPWDRWLEVPRLRIPRNGWGYAGPISGLYRSP